jgi:uncharacterized protein (DUF2235 family)
VKNIVMCFDHDRASSRATTNVGALAGLIDQTELTWYHSGAAQSAPEHRRRGGGSYPSLADAYLFLVDAWVPGDRVFVFGAGCGAFCARALTRLLNTVGVLSPRPDIPDDLREGLLEYVLENWALPFSHRTPEDWRRLGRLAADLVAAEPVPVHYLGLWDTVKVPGLLRVSSPGDDALANVVTGRHAVAIDERRIPAQVQLVSPATADRIEEVWFRGTHADITGGAGAHNGQSRIALEWVLDGARQAGLRVGDDAPAPSELDALANARRNPAMKLLAGLRLPNLHRELPDGALVHSSVEVYLRDNPEYWYRLPHLLEWADTGWPARGERLIGAVAGPRVRPRSDIEFDVAS